MFSSLLDTAKLVFDSKTEKRTKGYIEGFPGGKYYAENCEDNAYVYDINTDEIVWQIEENRPELIPVSSNCFVHESNDGRELIQIAEKTTTRSIDVDVCRLFGDILVYRGKYLNYVLSFKDGRTINIETKTWENNAFGIFMNKLNVTSDTLCFLNFEDGGKLWLYDAGVQDLKLITSFPNISNFYQFEYYPETYTLSTYSYKLEYQAWDSRFSKTPIFALPTKPQDICCVNELVFQIHDHSLSYMHYLYRNEAFSISLPTFAQVCYNAYTHGMDCYDEMHKYSYKIIHSA